MTVNNAELEFSVVKQAIIPFLRENWLEIDLPEQESGFPDGRLTMDELVFAYEKAKANGKIVDAYVLKQRIARYPQICRAHDDGYWVVDEEKLGISEEDISVYAQLLDPSKPSWATKPKPFRWLWL